MLFFSRKFHFRAGDQSHIQGGYGQGEAATGGQIQNSGRSAASIEGVGLVFFASGCGDINER